MDYFLANSSDCSSGCESGWTLYLENSFVSPHKEIGEKYALSEEKRRLEAEEEEDLSMVSDASSGPPHLPEEEDYVNENYSCFYHARPIDTALRTNSNNVKKIKEGHCRRKVHEQPSLLDDTASSPVFNPSNNNFTLTSNHASAENVVDFSQGYSTTHFEGRSAYEEHYGFLHPSLSGNYLQENQWCQGRRWQ